MKRIMQFIGGMESQRDHLNLLVDAANELDGRVKRVENDEDFGPGVRMVYCEDGVPRSAVFRIAANSDVPLT